MDINKITHSVKLRLEITRISLASQWVNAKVGSGSGFEIVIVEIEPKYSISNSSNFTKEKTIPGLRFVLLAVKTKQKC